MEKKFQKGSTSFHPDNALGCEEIGCDLTIHLLSSIAQEYMHLVSNIYICLTSEILQYDFIQITAVMSGKN